MKLNTAGISWVCSGRYCRAMNYDSVGESGKRTVSCVKCGRVVILECRVLRADEYEQVQDTQT